MSGKGGEVMEGFLEVVTYKLKETPEGEGGERKGADGSARGGGFTQSLALLEARNPVVVFLICPGWVLPGGPWIRVCWLNGLCYFITLMKGFL